MAVHVVTGKLGSGKTLVSVSRIQDYLARGRIVATNLNARRLSSYRTRNDVL